MEIKFYNLSNGYRFDVLEDAVSRVDGVEVQRNGDGVAVVSCMGEDDLREMREAAEDLEEKFEQDEVASIRDAARTVKEDLDSWLDD